MGKPLSNDIKWRVIYHQLDGFSAKETALRLYIGVSTVNKIRKPYNRWGCVNHPFKGYQGRRRTFNTDDLNVLIYFILLSIILKIITY